MNATERRALATILEVEAGIKRDLTEVERQVIAATIAENEELQRQAAIFNGIVGPLRQAQDEIASINILYGEGSITVAQYGQALDEIRDRGLTFEDRIASLQRENDLVVRSTIDRQALATVLEFESALKRDLTQTEQAYIRQLIVENEELSRQVSLYENITGPLRQAHQELTSLRILFDQGRISVDQYNQAVDEIRDRGLTFNDRIAALQRENDLIGVSVIERQALATVLEIESAIKRDLTQTEQAYVRQLAFENEELTRQADLYEGITGPLRQAHQELTSLRILFDQGRISVDQYNQAVDEVRERGLTFADRINALRDENALVRASVIERRSLATILDAESALKRDLSAD